MTSVLSPVAQEGLQKWARETGRSFPAYSHDPEAIDAAAEFWAWVWFQAREAEDKPEWFPHGKWATLQVLEQWLVELARERRTK